MNGYSWLWNGVICRVRAVLGHLVTGNSERGSPGCTVKGSPEDFGTYLVLQVSCLQVIQKNHLQSKFWMR